MKKIITTIFFVIFSFSQVSAEVGINVGISGSAGLFTASAKEVADETHKGSEHGAAAWGSIFIEKTLGDRLAVGVNYVPASLETETTESVRWDKTTTDTRSAKTNKVQVDFEELTTLYLALNLTENSYIKAGLVTVDVITNESLGTGSTYGNTELDGTSIGFGTNHNFDNGMFVRAEGNYMSFDGASLTSNDNTITLNNLDGVSASLSIGKSF